MPNRLHRPEEHARLRAAWRIAARAGALPGADRVLTHAAPLVFSPSLGLRLSARGEPAARDLVRHAFADVPGNPSLARSWAKFARRWPRGPQTQLLELYPRLQMPVLLLWADRDRLHPLAGAEETLELLPDAQLRVLSGTGFLIAYDDPVGLARELVGVLRIGSREPASIKESPMATKQLWGGETAKAVENFPISGETVPVAVVHWLARIKGAAAAVNGELGLLDKRRAARIEKAAAEIAAGKHDAQFPIDVFQTGSGTSTNTNANEVIAALAGERVHPNDHVNMGQSSNDVFPSAVHLAALDVAQQRAAAGAAAAGALLREEGQELRERRQGRAHAPDGRRPRHARAGVRRLRRADRARARSACARRSCTSGRSRSGAPPPAPA